MTQPVTLDEVLQEAVLSSLYGLVHVAMPAEVVSYDRVTQTASVQPILRARQVDEEGSVEHLRLPPLGKVPVQFPQGGGCGITWDLTAGDEVLLVIAERSLDEWKATNARDVSPQDYRRFDLTDAFAIPGIRSPSSPLTVAAGQVKASTLVLFGPALALGSGLATDYVALAALTLDRLTKLQQAFDSHVHATAAAGPPSTPTPVPGVIPVGALAPVASSKIKAV